MILIQCCLTLIHKSKRPIDLIKQFSVLAFKLLRNFMRNTDKQAKSFT